MRSGTMTTRTCLNSRAEKALSVLTRVTRVNVGAIDDNGSGDCWDDGSEIHAHDGAGAQVTADTSVVAARTVCVEVVGADAGFNRVGKNGDRREHAYAREVRP
jgi:hypothetical protein